MHDVVCGNPRNTPTSHHTYRLTFTRFLDSSVRFFTTAMLNRPPPPPSTNGTPTSRFESTIPICVVPRRTDLPVHDFWIPYSQLFHHRSVELPPPPPSSDINYSLYSPSANCTPRWGTPSSTAQTKCRPCSTTARVGIAGLLGPRAAPGQGRRRRGEGGRGNGAAAVAAAAVALCSTWLCQVRVHSTNGSQ